MSSKGNKKENIYSLTGLKKVTSFTFRETIKNKSFRITMITMVIMMMVMGSLQYFAAGTGASAAESAMGVSSLSGVDAEKLYMKNTTTVAVDDLADVFKNMELEAEIIMDAEESQKDTLGPADIFLLFEKKDGAVKIYAIVSDDSTLDYSKVMDLASVAANHYQTKKLESAGITDEKLILVQAGNYTGNVYSEEEYQQNESGEYTSTSVMMSIMGYAIIILIVASLSCSYIVTSVNEEKTSKLVEMLLVSVRPLALVLGKVLGMMGYVALVLVLCIAGSAFSNFFMTQIVGVNSASYAQTNMMNLNFISSFGPAVGIVMGFLILLAIFIFGMISGVAGSTCTKQEDLQSATGTTMMIVMAGYLAAIIAPAIENNVLNMVLSLVPPFSLFVAPVFYATGRIALWVFLLSIVIQLLLTVLLFVAAAKIYRQAILNDSKKLGFKDLVQMLKN